MKSPATSSSHRSAGIPAATPRSWFRSPGGRRYLRQLGAIVLVKLVLLTALYYALLKPAVRPDASPDAIRHLLLGTAPPGDGAAR